MSKPKKYIHSKHQISNAELITLSSDFFFKNLLCEKKTEINQISKYKLQYEYLTLPTNWNNPKSENLSMRIFHSNKHYEDAKNVFIYVNQGPGSIIDEALGNKILKELGRDWDVILFDQRGCGLSQYKLSGELLDFNLMTIDQTVEDICAIVCLAKSRKAEKIVLAGCSAGAFVTTKFSTKYSDTVDLLYIDGGAASSDFINLTNQVCINKISEILNSITIEKLAAFYSISEDLLFHYFVVQLCVDPMAKLPVWKLIVQKTLEGKNILHNYCKENIFSSIYDDNNNQLNKFITSYRLKTIMTCMEIIPSERSNTLYDFAAPNRILISKLKTEFKLKQKPFNFIDGLIKNHTKTIITNGMEDYLIPFEASKKIYNQMSKKNTLLLGFKKKAHVALHTENFGFIIRLIKNFLNDTRKSTKEMALNYNNAVNFD